MGITKWKGGQTGLEVMPENIVSMWYTEIHREVPFTYGGEADQPHAYGYYPGQAGPPYVTHKTLYPYRPGSLKVTIDNIELPVDETLPSEGTFKVETSTSGYLRATYHPFTDVLYFHKWVKTDVNLRNSPARAIPVPTSREHINQILNAIQNIAFTMESVDHRFSIEPYTGFPIRYNPDMRFDPAVPLLTQLYNEIGSHLIYMFNYAMSKYGAALVPEETFSYNSRNVRANVIEGFRSDINILEAALISLGVLT